jgi:magnesium-transporting ATPase (P-type)
MTDIREKSLDSNKWHSLDIETVIKELQTSGEEGLSTSEAEDRLEQFGRNKLPEEKKRSALIRFFAQFHNILIYLLLVAALITALMGHWIDTFVILAVVLINTFIGFIQEGKAEKAIEGIKKMLSLEATVIRETHRKKIEAEYLVPGDLVIVSSGDKIPADIRIIKAKNFRAEESILTGESNDVAKKPEPADENASLGDRFSLAFSGTMVTSGEAEGIVVATGEKTEIGKISRMLSDVEEITTPLLQRIESFGKQLSLFIVGLGVLVFVFAYFIRDYDLFEAIMPVIGIIVASIPEGLPAIMTITLAIGVQRMAKRHAIIRRLPSVETLGAVSVICSDKTGTLTRNEMTAKIIITAETDYDVEGTGYNPEGKVKKDKKEVKLSEETVLERFAQCITACNNAEVVKDNGNWKLEGTPTEGALTALSHKLGLDGFKPERFDSIPFDSEYKFMATLNETDGKRYIFVKGAPEKLLEMCSKQLTSEGEKEIDHSFWQEKFEETAADGQRLIAAAYKEVEKNENTLDFSDLEEDLILLGLTGIIDPPREEALKAIQECKEAGIRVVMITGDHAITARAISQELGIENSDEVITGADLEKMDDEKLREICLNHSVFARTSPEHKLRLVKALQANNLLCAMTGDGVNDAPALKRANIGIAMGIKGTEVSKDSSEMILTDDNFASIVNAVEEGRTVYDNLRKTILFLLPANGAEATVIIAAILFGLTLPITPVQILWVNMVSAVTLALSLSVEPMEDKVMKQPPRAPDKPILDGYFVWRVAFVSLLSGGITFYMFLRNHIYFDLYDIHTARTIAVNMLVAGHLFYLFTCRKLYESSISLKFFDNKFVFLSVGALIVLQLLFTYLPLMNNLFGTKALDFQSWRFPLLLGIVLFFLVESEKFLIRKIRGKK